MYLDSNRDFSIDRFFGNGLNTLGPLLPPTAGEDVGGLGPGIVPANPALDPQLDTGSAAAGLLGGTSPASSPGGVPPAAGGGVDLVALHNNFHGQQAADLNAFQAGQAGDLNAFQGGQAGNLANFQNQQAAGHDLFHNLFGGAIGVDPNVAADHTLLHNTQTQQLNNFQNQQAADLANFQAGQAADSANLQADQQTDHTDFHNQNGI